MPVPPNSGLLNTPVRMAPRMPPMQCTPNTSSESSYPSADLSFVTANRQTTPASAPMTSEPIGPTQPHAGVIATSPATAPEAAPSIVGVPRKIHSAKVQPHTAAAVARNVLMNTCEANAFASRFEPALKPNQPTHSSAAPTMMNGTL